MVKNNKKSNKAKRTKKQKIVREARIYIKATFNNTLINVTDLEGNTICWGSSGASGFKGARKLTPFAATTAIEDVLSKIKDIGIEEVDVYVKGPGPGRSAALRSLQNVDFKVRSISDITPIPHNGVRRPKKRRV